MQLNNSRINRMATLRVKKYLENANKSLIQVNNKKATLSNLVKKIGNIEVLNKITVKKTINKTKNNPTLR